MLQLNLIQQQSGDAMNALRGGAGGRLNKLSEQRSNKVSGQDAAGGDLPPLAISYEQLCDVHHAVPNCGNPGLNAYAQQQPISRAKKPEHVPCRYAYGTRLRENKLAVRRRRNDLVGASPEAQGEANCVRAELEVIVLKPFALSEHAQSLWLECDIDWQFLKISASGQSLG
ncbi:MAG: hypothetical protein Q8R01_04115 [Ramlibacter sp.]|nr:hypothetical protein [Ramlibacter sp.]